MTQKTHSWMRPLRKAWKRMKAKNFPKPSKPGWSKTRNYFPSLKIVPSIPSVLTLLHLVKSTATERSSPKPPRETSPPTLNYCDFSRKSRSRRRNTSESCLGNARERKRSLSLRLCSRSKKPLRRKVVLGKNKLILLWWQRRPIKQRVPHRTIDPDPTIPPWGSLI